MKNILILMAMGSLLTAQAKPLCKEIITNKFGSYLVKRQEFLKHNECILPMNESITNKETNQTIKLDGIVTGLESIDLNERAILKVNYFAGVHTHVVDFFFVAKNGDLTPVQGGSIGSDIGDPAIYIDTLSNILVVFSRYTKDVFSKKMMCRNLYEDIYEYKEDKFTKIIDKSLIEKDCQED